MLTVPLSYLKSLGAFAGAHGINVAPVLGPLGLNAEAKSDKTTTIDIGVAESFLQTLSAHLHDPFLGLHWAEHGVTARTLGLLGYLLRASPDGIHALKELERYSRLFNISGFELVVEADRTKVLDGPLPPLVAQVSLASQITLARSWTGVHIVPLEVQFQQKRPAHSDEFERVFGCRVLFGQPVNSVTFSRASLLLPFTTAEPELVDYLKQLAEWRLERLPTEPVLMQQVRMVVLELLGNGSPRIAVVARRLGVSVRSLQRGLKDSGVSFRDLVDEAREEWALRLLREGKLPVAAVADMVGFSEPSALRRAARRWREIPPKLLRLPANH